MYTPPNTLKWSTASESGFNSRNAFVYIRGSYSSKNIAKSRWSVHLRLGRHPKKQAFGTVFDPQQPLERDATEPHIWPNVYLADALLREPVRIIRAQLEQTLAWPKHADVSGSHGTLSVRPAGSSANIPRYLLHVTGPSQCPRVDEPHPASIACARPPVAGSARKGVAHAVRDSTGVTYGHQGKLAQDALNGNDVKDRLLVVKFVHHTRSNRLQPSCKKEIRYN